MTSASKKEKGELLTEFCTVAKYDPTRTRQICCQDRDVVGSPWRANENIGDHDHHRPQRKKADWKL